MTIELIHFDESGEFFSVEEYETKETEFTLIIAEAKNKSKDALGNPLYTLINIPNDDDPPYLIIPEKRIN